MNLHEATELEDEPARLVLAGDCADPTILRHEGNYFLTGTPIAYRPGFILWHSKDLRSWSPVGNALAKAGGDIWAAELAEHDVCFFLYYFELPDKLVVIHAKTPEGPWSAPHTLLAPTDLIDPGHVVAADGSRHLHLAKGFVAPLAADGLSLIGPPRQVLQPWKIPSQWRIEAVALEGPKLVWREGWCYMLFAMGGTAGPSTSHMILVARSRNGVDGWCVDPAGPLLRTTRRSEQWWSRGHGTLFRGPEDEWFVIYHAYRAGARTLGRQPLVERIGWTNDGWPRRSMLPPWRDNTRCGSQAANDDFQSPVLAPQWQSFAQSPTRIARCRSGSLHLDASEPGTFLGITAGVEKYFCEIEIAECPLGVMAGLCLFYSPEVYHGLIVREGKLYKEIAANHAPHRRLLEQVSLPLRLRVVNVSDEVDFYWRSPDETQWTKCFFSSELSGFNTNVFGRFLFLRPGLVARGEGQAVFSKFKYELFAKPESAQWMTLPQTPRDVQNP